MFAYLHSVGQRPGPDLVEVSESFSQLLLQYCCQSWNFVSSALSCLILIYLFMYVFMFFYKAPALFIPFM